MQENHARFEVHGYPLDENEPHFLAEGETKKIAEFDDAADLYGFMVQQSPTKQMNQTVFEYSADESRKEETASVLIYQLKAENPPANADFQTN